MPGPDDKLDAWADALELTAAARTRMDAHVDVLLEVALQADQRANPGEPADEEQAAYMAAAVLLQRAALTRTGLSAVLSLLLVDAALAIGAEGRDADGHLHVVPERCRQGLFLIWRAGRDQLEERLGETTPAPGATGPMQ